MSLSFDFVNLARDFWQQSGRPIKPPCDVEDACPRVLPLAIVQLPDLTHHTVSVWLQKVGVGTTFPVNRGRLRGCVVGYKGHGFLFVDCLDSPNERRFTIAHEVGHFLVDYLVPRKRAVERLGESVLDILDGKRQPTLDERAYALISDVSLPVYRHTSAREGLWGCPYLAGNSEAQADQLALELLAPETEIHRRVKPAKVRRFSQLELDIKGALENEFHLPPSIVRVHARKLAFSWTGGQSVREWFGLV